LAAIGQVYGVSRQAIFQIEHVALRRTLMSYEIRKIVKVGNSHMIVIPPYYLKWLGLKKGDRMALEFLEGKGLLVKRLNKT